jgi:hypothetical protein
MYNLEERFNCQKEMDLLEKEFKKYLETKQKTRTIEGQLRQIKDFLLTNNEARQRLFSRTRLTKSDCITLSIITQMLAQRRGLNIKVGFPKQIKKFLHAFLIYKKNGKERIFEIAGGNSKSKNPESLDEKALLRRFRLTRPFILSKKLTRKK